MIVLRGREWSSPSPGFENKLKQDLLLDFKGSRLRPGKDYTDCCADHIFVPATITTALANTDL